MPSQNSSRVALIRVVEAAEVLEAVHPVTTPMVTVREVDVLHVTPCSIDVHVGVRHQGQGGQGLGRGEASRFHVGVRHQGSGRGEASRFR